MLDIDDEKRLCGKIYIEFDNDKTGRKRKKHEKETTIEAVTARFNLSQHAPVSVNCRQHLGMLVWDLTTHKAQRSTYTEMVANMTKPAAVRSVPQEISKRTCKAKI